MNFNSLAAGLISPSWRISLLSISSSVPQGLRPPQPSIMTKRLWNGQTPPSLSTRPCPTAPLMQVKKKKKVEHTSLVPTLFQPCDAALVLISELFDSHDDRDDDPEGESVEEHKSVIMHLLSQVRLGMDLTKVNTAVQHADWSPLRIRDCNRWTAKW